ncbi:hypothetical protein BC739_005667 [Kutzneria viridogrisea]|uniref:Uncharacterized protein n=2 Tax=Kutzneria TaxID=43356 RepID=W5WDR9_9PSEU|nr:hypothetical protein [Kutzneria albida]AHH96334.1 hypothetical protein KALB_2966 [Kutzneria albida DSM 43870]MBA8928450.1 hypothetical protein [Kutzneria viridogrisea]
MTGAGRPRLPIPVRDELVDLLLGVDELWEDNVRALLESDLRERLSPEFYVPSHSAVRRYVLALLDQCQEHPGGLRKLLEAVRALSPGHYLLDEIADLIALHVPLELLLPAERTALRRLLTGLTVEVDVLALHRAAVGPIGPPLTVPPTDLLAVLDELANTMCPPGQLPPLFVFVEHVACAVDGGGYTAAALRQWNSDVAHRCELPPQLLAVAREGAHSRVEKPPGRPALLVQVEEDGLDPDRYQLSVWLWFDHTACESLFREDRTYELSEIPDVIDRLLLDCGERLPAAEADLTVEFILPHRLLVAPVDNWLISSDSPFRREVGVDFPVVVRSLERLRNRSLSLRAQWRAKWRWLQEQSGQRPGEGVRWVGEEEGADPARLFRELAGEQPVCLAWDRTPTPEHQSADSVLGAAIFAGTPVALWCREDHGAGGHEQAVELLTGGSLLRLPDHALRARQEAGLGGADHCGHHLSLLWDDPSRLPEPDLGLSAPTASGGSTP